MSACAFRHPPLLVGHAVLTEYHTRYAVTCGQHPCPYGQRHQPPTSCPSTHNFLAAGKTECARCHSAFGRFCRACLLIRYGSELECVRKQMADGTWLCPHCYEEENPNAVSTPGSLASVP